MLIRSEWSGPIKISTMLVQVSSYMHIIFWKLLHRLIYQCVVFFQSLSRSILVLVTIKVSFVVQVLQWMAHHNSNPHGAVLIRAKSNIPAPHRLYLHYLEITLSYILPYSYCSFMSYYCHLLFAIAQHPGHTTATIFVFFQNRTLISNIEWS